MRAQKKRAQDPLVPPDKDAPDLRKRPPKKQKGAKDPAVLPDKHAPVPQDLRKSPPENNIMTTILMPIGAYASKGGMLPNTRAQEIPTLPAIQTQEARYPTRGNLTPALLNLLKSSDVLLMNL